VQRVATRLNGLKVNQYEDSQSSYFLQPPEPSPLVYPDVSPTAVPMVATLGSPFFNFRTIGVFAGSTSSDAKVYIRQRKISGILTNHTNSPVYVQRISFWVRKNINASEYPSIYSILTTDTPSGRNPGMALTTSANAQRLLKFGKTKVYYMPCGSMRRFKLNQKYYAPRLYNQDIENDYEKYSFLRGNKGYIFRVQPMPMTNYSGPTSNPLVVGTYWNNWNVSIRMTYYASCYLNGDNNPTSLFTPWTPVGSVRASIMTDQIPQPSLVV
jgi:hypothetical protein